MLASEQVLQRVVALLLAGPTAAGARVFDNHFHPVATFPAIKVQLRDEDMAADDEGDSVSWPRVQLHSLQLEVLLLLEASACLSGERRAECSSGCDPFSGT